MNKRAGAVAAGAIFACLLWASAFVAIKIGLKYCKPLSFAGIRFIISGLLLLPFWLGREPLKAIRANFKTILLASLFQTVLLYGLFNLGMVYVSGALGAIIIGSSPLAAAILAHFFMSDDKLTVPKIISFLIGVAGIVIISLERNPHTAMGLNELFGIGLLILAAFASGLGNIVVAKHKGQINVIQLNSIQIFTGGCVLLVLGTVFEGVPDFDQPRVFYLSLIWLSFISAGAFTIWFALLKKPGVKVSDLNLWKFIIPVFGAAFSWLFLSGDSPTVPQLIGMACVAVSIVSFNFAARKSKKNPAEA